MNVEIRDHAYHPMTLSASGETEITFTNNESEEHTATANNGEFNIHLQPGESGSVTLSDPRTYPYFCEYHPEMTGTIIIE